MSEIIGKRRIYLNIVEPSHKILLLKRKVYVEMTRRYPQKDVKLLFGLSASICAFPGCLTRCIEEASPYDKHAVIGEIAHIESHSDDGPRANPHLSPEQRDSYENWVLLCPTHHTIVDKQPNTYTAEDLRKWKQDIEKWVKERYLTALPKISFAELEIITQYIIDFTGKPSNDLTILPPREKITKNNFSDKVDMFIKMGLIQFSLVNNYIVHMEMIQPNYPERLKKGFIEEYNRLKNKLLLKGDALFFQLLNFASGGRDEFEYKSSGLAVLTYLFAKCEVFEK